MKLWIRFLAGGVVGILLGLYLPMSGGDTPTLFRYLASLATNVGIYAVFPLVLFGLATSTRELREDRLLGRVFGTTIGYIAISTAILVAFGTIAVFVLSPERIPIVIQEAAPAEQPLVSNLLLQVFPGNIFRALFDASYLLPTIVLAIVLGITLNGQGLYTSPVADFADSASRIFYRINRFVVEFIAIGIIALSAKSILELRQLGELNLFGQLFLTVGFTAGLVIAVGVPLAIYFWGGKRNPVEFLYTILPPALAGFFSGNSYFTLGILTRIGNETMGISRKAGAAVFPLSVVFAKAGTAMVSAISFVLVLRSYSSLELTFGQFLWVIVFSFLVSYVLGAVPGSGVVVSLSVLSSLYGRGLQNGYLILQSAEPILIAVGALLDVVITGAIAHILTFRLRLKRDAAIENYP